MKSIEDILQKEKQKKLLIDVPILGKIFKKDENGNIVKDDNSNPIIDIATVKLIATTLLKDKYLKGETPEFTLITENTSSVAVGVVDGVIYKIYDNESSAKREALILNKLEQDDLLEHRCQDLIRPEELSILSKHDPNIDKQDYGKQCKNTSKLYIQINDYFILFSKKVEEKIKQQKQDHDKFPPERLLWIDLLKDYKDRHLTRTLIKATKELLPEEEDIASWVELLQDSEYIQRLYTLSILHSNMKDRFSKYEIKEYGLQKYHDFKYNDVLCRFLSKENNQKYAHIFDDDLRRSYILARKNQRNLHHKRSDDSKNIDSLVFTHGDAKWDNWLDYGETLVDFGSSKISTEYKDIAKALLDFDEILDLESVDEMIEFYSFFRNEISSKNIKENIEDFKRNVYESILLESMRTLYYKPNDSVVVDHLVKVIEKYKQVVSKYYEKDPEPRESFCLQRKSEPVVVGGVSC